MLNFDEDRYVAIESAGLDVQPDVDRIVSNLIATGAENLFFLGAGGVMFLTQPAYNLLRTDSTFPVFYEMGAELVEAGNRHLGPKSIVVTPSVSGTTKEAVAALEYAKARGATIIAFTGSADTPIGALADHNFTRLVVDDTSSEMYYLQTLLVALSVMKAKGEIDDYDEVVGELLRLPRLLVDVKRGFDDRAEDLAKALAADDYHILTGAGPAWTQAHYYGMCILEEMQWIRTRPVHASDFFHGTLELVEPGVSVFIFKGEDKLRPLTERVEAFATRFTDKVHVLDTRELALPGISARTRALISHVLLAAVLERVSVHLEAITHHPLTTRRYYKQFEY
jgi:fructoselysine-6-phosphate deglycase